MMLALQHFPFGEQRLLPPPLPLTGKTEQANGAKISQIMLFIYLSDKELSVAVTVLFL